jgi:iron complex transport system permease protein
MALLVGASLACSGYLMQILVNNPLADPYILGTSGGAALGVNLGLAGLLPLWVGTLYMPPVYAMLGAAGITSAVFLFAKSRSGLQSAKLLLSGVFLSMLSTALVGLLVFLAIKHGMSTTVLFWTMGSLEKTSWTGLAWLSACLAVMLSYFSWFHHRFILLMLGDEKARNFGINPTKIRVQLLVGAAMLTGLSVAFCGAIGFIGLMIPHVVRQFCGVTHGRNLVYCALLGSAMLTWADVMARSLYPPAGLPVGIVTALVGVPFFLYLLAKNAKTFA